MLRNDKDDIDRFSGAKVIRSESAVDLTSAITDFYKFGDKEVFEIIQTRGEKELPEEIILHTYVKNFSVKVDNLVRHSVKIRELVEKNNLPRIVNLTNFNVGSVKIFVKYINCGHLTEFRLVSNRVLDLLQIARIFHVYSLVDNIAKYLVSTIGPKFDTVLMLNLLVIASDWSLALNQNLRSTVYTVASNNFVQLWKSANFPKIPFSILILLFNRCDLIVKDEFEIVNLILQWLDFTKRSEIHAKEQFEQKEIIIRLSISSKSNGFSKIFEDALNSPRSQRCCIVDAHIKAGYKRCGIPEWNEELRPMESIKITVSQKIQEEKDVTFVDKTRPLPCLHKNDGILSDEPSESSMQFWGNQWSEEKTCGCNCHQNPKKKITQILPKIIPEKKGSPSKRKSKKSITSTKSDSVLLSGKFPHLHAPKPSSSKED